MNKYETDRQALLNQILEEIEKENKIKILMLERISQVNFPNELTKAYEDCITYSKGKIKGLREAIKIIDITLF